MDNNTLDFYNNNSKTYIETTISAEMNHLYNEFLEDIPEGGHILDLGCGSGRDSLEFIKRGYKVTAVDGSEEMAKGASQIIGKEVIVSKFEELKLTESYDGVWACASLLHVNKKDIIDVIKNISASLKENGVFYMSFKYGDKEYVDEKGRYFNCYTKESFKEIIKDMPLLGVKSISKTDDTIGGRAELQWLNITLKKYPNKLLSRNYDELSFMNVGDMLLINHEENPIGEPVFFIKESEANIRKIFLNKESKKVVQFKQRIYNVAGVKPLILMIRMNEDNNLIYGQWINKFNKTDRDNIMDINFKDEIHFCIINSNNQPRMQFSCRNIYKGVLGNYLKHNNNLPKWSKSMFEEAVMFINSNFTSKSELYDYEIE